MSMMAHFRVVILMMLFYSVGINILTYSIPDDELNYVTSMSDLTHNVNLEEVSSDVQGSIEKQSSVPVVELGALVFYSGNIILDLLLNFAFAIPEMIGIVVNGVSHLFNIDSYLFALFELFSAVVIWIFYIIGLIEMLVDVRATRGIT